MARTASPGLRLIRDTLAPRLRTLCAAWPIAMAAFCVAAGIAGELVAAPTWFVLNTGSGALPSHLAPPAGTSVIEIGPNNPTATINGSTIRYLGTESVAPIFGDPFAGGATPSAATAAKFFVAGDLNLLGDQRIYGAGSNLIKLEVGNNANLAAGSSIDVGARLQVAGAGGGAGAAPQPRASDGWVLGGRFADGHIPVTDNQGFGAPTTTSGNSGTDGQDGKQRIYRQNGTPLVADDPAELRPLFASAAGNAGGTGQGNAATTTGGAATAFTESFPTPGGGGNGGDPGLGYIALFIPAPGNPGGQGGIGGPGEDGLDGKNAGQVQSLINPTATHLRAGSGGGSGATGGDGLYGGNGGGGGGGGTTEQNLSGGGRNPGYDGGNGGFGGDGGAGGFGGIGGAGGGGLQLLVRGRLVYAGNISAHGGNATPGGSGAYGADGRAGDAGEQPPPPQAFVTYGGAGGNGGNGGAGGAGGDGGYGAGGEGGVVQVIASTSTFSSGGTMVLVGGFNGNFVDRAPSGSAYYDFAAGIGRLDDSNAWLGARAAGFNPYRSYRVPITGGTDAPPGLTPNVPGIEGGAAAYGLLTEGGSALETSLAIEFAANFLVPPTPGHKRVGAVTRVPASFLADVLGRADMADNNQQVLLYSAFSDALSTPALLSVDPTHTTLFDVVPTGPVRLRAGSGYLNDPGLTPGATTPTNMAALPAHRTFATYATGTQNVTAQFSPYGEPRTFRGTPAVPANGDYVDSSTVFLEDNGKLLLGIQSHVGSNIVIDSQAYFENEASGEVPFSAIPIRAGAVATFKASVEGEGNVGTATNGAIAIRTRQVQASQTGPLYTQFTHNLTTVGVGQRVDTATASMPTTGLPVGTRQRAAEAIFSPNYDSDARNIVVSLNVDVLGPTPQLRGAGTNGTTFVVKALPGTNSSASFELLNGDLTPVNSTWNFYKAANPTIMQLSVMGMELVDPAGVFSLPATAPFALGANGAQMLNVGFHPTSPGAFQATLRIHTDWNADVGQQGQDFNVTLVGSALYGADFDEDGIVDGDDLTRWNSAFGLSAGAVHTQGDANGDGAVNGTDFLAWQRQLGSSSLPAVVASQSTVPEPASLELIAAAVAGLWARRRGCAS